MQDDRRIAKLRKADSFSTSTEIKGQMAADYGCINVSVQATRRRRNEFKLSGRIVQKTRWCPTSIKKKTAFNSTEGIFTKVPIIVVWLFGATNPSLMSLEVMENNILTSPQ